MPRTFDNFSLAAEGTGTNGSPPEILDTEVTANTIHVLCGPAGANAEYQLKFPPIYKAGLK